MNVHEVRPPNSNWKQPLNWQNAEVVGYYKPIKIMVHSGRKFKSYRYLIEPDGTEIPIWPIREYLIRTNHDMPTIMRIIKQNPRGKPEGYAPHGLR